MINENFLKYINEGKGFVAVMAGSGSDDKPKGDKPSHIGQIVKSLEKYDVSYGVHIASAHKQADELNKLLEEYNSLGEPILIVAVAGGTDALSGTASWQSYHPVVSCPPDAPNESCLKNPPGSSNATIYRPDNVGRFAAQMFAFLKDSTYLTLTNLNEKKINGLHEDDAKISGKYLHGLEEKENEKSR